MDAASHQSLLALETSKSAPTVNSSTKKVATSTFNIAVSSVNTTFTSNMADASSSASSLPASQGQPSAPAPLEQRPKSHRSRNREALGDERDQARSERRSRKRSDEDLETMKRARQSSTPASDLSTKSIISATNKKSSHKLTILDHLDSLFAKHTKDINANMDENSLTLIK